MASKLGVGVVGCGNISNTYFELAPLFKGIEITRLRRHQHEGRGEGRAKNSASRRMEPVDGAARSRRHRHRRQPDHARPRTSTCRRQALEAGKHVYSEKPFVLSLKDGLELQKLAAEEGRESRLRARHLPRRLAPAGAQR